ncbi:MAG: hypothetical protein D6696_03785 [Acidobacteria bacterium]|nr:MAG: hypothetical protein D6696_03785 [Acidobacteriota bacterium]
MHEPMIDQRAARALLLRLLLFLLPLAALAAPLELALWWSGDAWPEACVQRLQQRAAGEVLYGRRYFSQQFGVYKLAGIRERRPRILVAGSSRVMQIRDLMFEPLADRFYNAGGIWQNASDLGRFADLIAGDRLPAPEVLIAGIDPWWLRLDEGGASWLDDGDQALSPGAHLQVMRSILHQGRLRELLGGIGKPARSPFFRYRAIGSAAREVGAGFRRDGSWQYPPRMLLDYLADPHYADRETPPVIERIRRASGHFALPAAVDEAKLARVVASLAELQARGIEVWALLPPFSSECFAALEESTGLRDWWQAYHLRLASRLEARGVRVISAPTPAADGLSDDYMIDGFHGSEVYLAHVVARILDRAPPTSLLKRVDDRRLAARIRSAAIPLAFELPPAGR